MPESTTSSQSSPSTTNGVPNSVVTSSDGHWNQIDSTNILQNTTPLEWRELPTYSTATAPVTSNVSSEYHVTSSVNNVNVNVLSSQLVYNPQNYMNVPYQNSTVPNGYTTLNPARGINAQNGPHLLRTQNGPVNGGSPWPNQTALGRFISQSPGWTSNKTTGGVKKQKRIRTAFTSQQMMELEQEYSRTRYLDRTRRIELAEILRLNERTIKIWFQNRRMKEKKDRAESLEDSEEASTSESSPEIVNIQMPMLIHEQYPGFGNEIYNQGNIYMEQYPAVSAPVSIPVTNLSTSMPQDHFPVQNMYQTYMSEEERQVQYQQVRLEVQPYPSSYNEVKNEVQELSPEVVPKTEPPTPSAPSDIIEKSWDLSWIKTMQYEDDF